MVEPLFKHVFTAITHMPSTMNPRTQWAASGSSHPADIGGQCVEGQGLITFQCLYISSLPPIRVKDVIRGSFEVREISSKLQCVC